MTLKQLLSRYQAQRDALVTQNAAHDATLERVSALPDDSTMEQIAEARAQVIEAKAARETLTRQIAEVEAEIRSVEADIADQDQIERDRLVTHRTPGGEALEQARAAAGARFVVTGEQRTYDLHRDRSFDTRTGQLRPNAHAGEDFLRDVASAAVGNYLAQERLARHMREEEVERGAQLTGMQARATATGNFAGLTVPQYLTDLYARAATNGRPFANSITQRPLPDSGMTVELSRITTGTAVGLQATQNTNVAEQDLDDTQLSIPVQTAGGRQTMSLQAVQRSTNAEDVTIEDLIRRYATVLDATLITQAATGLDASSTPVTYTDATPTAAEMYPRVIEAMAGVEAALLDVASGENLAVMHSRRWYWMQSQLSSTWPLIMQPGIAAQMAGSNDGEPYGAPRRGVLPNGTPVIVDNNIPTNFGAGTNEDRIYVVDRRECHLWEDPAAPLLIRAEQPAVQALGVTLVIYGFFAYTFGRYPHARAVSGTGLVAPVF